MFNKVLIANRGEIAVRIMATAAKLGIRTVAIYSEVDRNSLHVRKADESVNLGDGPASENYLNPEAIIEAALKTGAEAIHPGYGFLAENAKFARAIKEAGLVFVGPSDKAISSMGEKVTARELAVSAGVPLAPGSNGAIDSAEQVLAFGEEHGYPLLVKASAGGGGRGMRRINSADEAADAMAAAVREAEAAFGNGEVYLERYLTNARHVEVQVLADNFGNVVYFGDRDCSVQRRHQKLIEEAPAPGLSEQLRTDMGEAAVRLAKQVNYSGAGTVEFLVENDKFYFLEMNTRIQVEHPVTELIHNVDLIEYQFRVAYGDELSVAQNEIRSEGAAVEVRLNAEDTSGGLFIPTPGEITKLNIPDVEGLRFDAGYEAGDEVLPLYDSLVGKLIAFGTDRETAIERMIQVIDGLDIEGVKTTAPAAKIILEHEDFRMLNFGTLWLESTVVFPEHDEEPPLARNEVEVGGRYYLIPYFNEYTPGAPAGLGGAVATEEPAQTGRPRAGGGRRKSKNAFDGTVKSPMQGTIVDIKVEPGQEVKTGDVLFVQEAMKMENPIKSPVDGTVGEILVTLGQALAAGTALTTLTTEKVTV